MKDKKPWYYTNNEGTQQGPVSKDTIEEMMSTGSLAPYNMVWKQGMEEWMMVSQVDELKAKETAPVTPPPPTPQATEPGAGATSMNPYAPPSAESPTHAAHALQDEVIEREYGGIGRLSYFLQTIGYVIGLIASIVVTYHLLDPGTLFLIIVLVAALVFIVLMIRLHYRRLINIGMSPWWLVLLIIPIANNILNIILMACPQGYAQTKKLDVPGMIIATIMILFLILSFVSGGVTGLETETFFDKAPKN